MNIENVLDGEDYQQECDNYIKRSMNHEIVLQKVKNRLYLFSMINDVI